MNVSSLNSTKLIVRGMKQVMNISLRLKIYKATLWHYHQLYLKEYAAGGLLDYEFDELKDLFTDVLLQAKELMRLLFESQSENSLIEIDEMIDTMENFHLIRYAKKWKSLYSGLYKRIMENRIVVNDRRNLFAAYGVLSSLDTSSVLWHIKIGQKIEFLYYEFSNGYSHVSQKCVIPKEVKYDKDEDIVYLVVEDASSHRQTYLLDLIINEKYDEE